MTRDVSSPPRERLVGANLLEFYSIGFTVAYRGRLADLARVEDFEDRLVDYALEMGGMVQVWRSWADDDPGRIVRGVMVRAVRHVSPDGDRHHHRAGKGSVRTRCRRLVILSSHSV
jgi:hypothetical protein